MKDATAMSQPSAPKANARSAWLRPGWFVPFAGAVLALVGANNLLQGLEKQQVLQLREPLSGLSFHYFLPGLAMAQLLVACVCLFTRKWRLSLWLTFWLTFDCMVYRVGLWSMGWEHPWVFVGWVTDPLHLPPLVADALLFVVGHSLVLGCAWLLLQRKEKPAEALKVSKDA